MKDGKNKIIKSDSWDHETALKNALLEREKLLKERPELHKLQTIIDNELSGVDSFEKRMKLLGKMIGISLDRLHEECSSLDKICNKIGIRTEIPILELKKFTERKNDVKALETKTDQNPLNLIKIPPKKKRE